MNANPYSPPQAALADAPFEKGMRLEYELKFSDLVRFSCTHQFLSPVLQTLFILLALYFYMNEQAESGVSGALLSAFFWYCGMWIFQFIFNAIFITGKNRAQLTEHAIEISDESFYEETKYNKSHFFWPGIVKAVSRPGFVAVYTSQHSAHIIPDRAFISDEQREKFLELVKQMMKAAAGK